MPHSCALCPKHQQGPVRCAPHCTSGCPWVQPGPVTAFPGQLGLQRSGVGAASWEPHGVKSTDSPAPTGSPSSRQVVVTDSETGQSEGRTRGQPSRPPLRSQCL